MEDSRCTRTLEEIQKKIDQGDVVVLTAEEICNRVRKGDIIDFQKVDVVTAATSAIMSGTYAVLSFKVTEPDVFVKANQVWINGVPAQPGPCPNERIGLLDLIVLGTSASKNNRGYGGGHLFRELLEGNEVSVEVETNDGSVFSTTTTIKKIPLAMLHATRNAFKNYVAFVNPGTETINSIFHAESFQGDLKELTFCGCGELNPLEKDPDLKTIGVGSRVLINGAQGYVTGPGTRSSKDKPNLAGFADMHQMDPSYMGGFNTAQGPDIITTWAVAIPVLDADILKNVLKTDEEIGLNVVDLRNRVPIYQITYGDVWKPGDSAVIFSVEKCLRCEACLVAATCPVGAVASESGKVAVFDSERCFNCGLCVSKCEGKAFLADLGTVPYTEENTTIPISLRNSNRPNAIKAARELKQKIIDKSFTLNTPVEKISFKEYQ